MSKKVAIIMGSGSDTETVLPAAKQLAQFGIPFEIRVISAHRDPYEVQSFATTVKANGFGVIIAAAGKAAHLAGVIASYTTLPVIGIPLKSSTLDGLDSLLSVVQMPSGVPVASVAIDGAQNAAILAAQILAVSDSKIEDKLEAYKQELSEKVRSADIKLQEQTKTMFNGTGIL